MDEETYLRLYRTVHHVQELDEFRWLISEVEKLKPSVILEIGVHHGGSLKFWEAILKPGDLLVGVDYEPQLDWNVAASDRRIVIVTGNSTAEETVRGVREALGGRLVDFAFLDGSHEYETVRMDFENYAPMVRNGGIIAIHDIWTEAKQAGRFFEELEAKYPNDTAKMCRVQGTGLWWKRG